MRYKQFITIIYIVLFSLFSAAMEEKSAYKSKELIKRFASISPKGTVLVLGSGPADDLPIEWLSNKFHRIIFVDGNLDEIKTKVENMRLNRAMGSATIEFKQMDLCCGYDQIIEDSREEAIAAVAKDLVHFLRNETMSEWAQFLKKKRNFELNLEQFHADLVISLLVKSTIELRTYNRQATIFGNAIIEAKAYGLEIDPLEFLSHIRLNFHNKDSIFGKLRQATKQHLERVYLSAIANSGAKLIYYADMENKDDLAEQESFSCFKLGLINKYALVSRGDDPWGSDPLVTISHYEFIHKSLPNCSSCNKYDPSLKLCGGCKKTLYCSYECQKVHWAQHKERCGLCAFCRKSVGKLQKCANCKTRYCGRACQTAHWLEHKTSCGSKADIPEI